jgi:peptidoglycan hydrolase-like protein with peptidoglycan-binding domain
LSFCWARIKKTFSLVTVALFAAGLASASSKKSAQKSSAAEIQSTSSSTAKKSKSTRHSSRRHHRKSASWRRHAQKGIDSERTREIQTALIREKYFHGQVTGAWDRATTEAMKRYQQDHGWQIKTVPDARALIELGLGPSNEHLLNPESAMTTRRQNAAAGVAGRNQPAGPAALPQ